MKQILYFLVLLISLMACDRNYTAKKIDCALAIVNQNPDSALAMLSMCKTNDMSEQEKARYALAYTIAQDKSGLDVDNDSLIRIAFDYYKSKESDSLYCKCQYYMGKYYLLTDSTMESEQCFNASINAAQKIKDKYTEYLALEKLSYLLKMSNPQESASYAEQAYIVYQSMSFRNKFNEVYLLSNIGVCNACARNKSKSIDAHRKAIKLSSQIGDSVLVSRAYYDAAISYTRFEMSDSALYYASKAYESDSSTMLLYAMCLSDVGEHEKAKPLFEKDYSSETPRDKYMTCKYLCMISINQNQHEKACQYLDSACNEIEKRYMNLYNLEGQYYSLSLEKAKKVEKMKTQTLIDRIITIFIAVILLFAFFFVLYIYVTHKKYAARRFKLENERRKLQTTIDANHLDYQLRIKALEKKQALDLANQKHQYELEKREEMHMLQMSTKNLQIDLMRKYLLDKLEFISRLKEEGHDTNSTKRIVISDADWEQIEVFLEGVDCLFVTRLRESFPNLSLDDIRFCMLLRLGFKTKELANFYCINDRSVKQKQFKFKSKIGLNDPNVSLKKYILDF